MKNILFFVMLFNLLIVSFSHAEHKIIESAFCLSMRGHECLVPNIGETVSLSKILTIENGVKRLCFWTKIQVEEDKNIMHVWSAEGTNEIWTERVHVSRSDKIRNLTVDIIKESMNFLRILKNSNPKLNNVQGVMLPIGRSPRFRTYSTIKVKQGKYTVGVYDLDFNMVANGGPKTITVVP